MLRGRFLGFALLAASPLAAQPADPLGGKVRALAHPRYAEREKAARELEAAGEPALKALREAAQSGDEELRARAAAVADRVERSVRSQRLLTAPKLALKFDRTPLDQAVREFAAKTLLHCVLDKSKIKNPDRNVTLDTGEVPYWEAVDAFYRAAGLAEDDSPAEVTKTQSARGYPAAVRREYAPQCGAAVGNDDDPADRWAADRPGRPPLSPADPGMPPNFGQNAYDDVKGEVTFHLDVEAAPGLALREIVGVEVRKATAEDGRLLAPAYPAPPPVGGLGYEEQLILKQVMIANGNLAIDGLPGGSAQAVTLKTGGLRPKKLAALHGVVVARVVTPPEPLVTVTRPLQPGTREATADGTTVQVKDVTAGTDKRVVGQVRVVTRTDSADDVLNVPLQVRGRVRPFIRINRGPGRGASTAGPEGPRRRRATRPRAVGPGNRDDVRRDDGGAGRAAVVREAGGWGDDQLSLVLMGRRAAMVELPFVLKDVPLP